MPHVIPVDDLREHEADVNCWCGPVAQDGVVMHQAADHREEYGSPTPAARPWAIVEPPPFES